jgi:hypothetical protein
MAIDLDALRAKHQQLTNPTQAGNTDFLKKFYQVKEGEAYLRILPEKDGSDKTFYAETKIHRVPTDENSVKNYHCRKVHGEKCPLCDLYYGLWKTGSKEDEDLARQIKPRARYYLNVFDRASEEVKIFSIGVILFQKIVETMMDADYADLFENSDNGILDTEIGHDFKLHMKKEGKWPKYDQSMFRPKATSLGSKKLIAEVMSSLHDVHGLVKVEEYDAVKEAAQILRPAMGVKERSLPKEDTSEEVSDDDYTKRLMS